MTPRIEVRAGREIHVRVWLGVYRTVVHYKRTDRYKLVQAVQWSGYALASNGRRAA